MAPSRSLFRSNASSKSPSFPQKDEPTVLSMPNVFVVPPEEDQSPTWCYFDANRPADTTPTTPDYNFFDIALSLMSHSSQDAAYHEDAGFPIDTREAIIMPRRSADQRSLDEALDDEDEDYGELVQEQPRSSARTKDVGNDSEVVEVVKVGRRSQDKQSSIPRSKTFKSRASKAFRSFKKVARSTSTSRPSAAETIPPSISRPQRRQSKEETRSFRGREQKTPSPSLTRRGSIVLSQLFNSSSVKSRASFEIPITSGSEPAFPSSDSRESSPFTHVYHSSTAPSLDLLDAEGAYDSHLDTGERDRSSSPSPSTRTFSTRKRFSVMSLQRLFSFSAPDVDSVQSSSDAVIPRSVPSLSHDSSGPSTISSTYLPETPSEESSGLPQVTEQGERRSTASLPHIPKDEPPTYRQDVSFEMQLDSLHFDSLSFDLDQF